MTWLIEWEDEYENTGEIWCDTWVKVMENFIYLVGDTSNSIMKLDVASYLGDKPYMPDGEPVIKFRN